MTENPDARWALEHGGGAYRSDEDPPKQDSRMDVIERCPGRTPDGECHRRAAHLGPCITGGSYAMTMDERDVALQQLEGAVSRMDALREAILAYDALAPDDPAFHDGSAWRVVLDRLGGQ